MPHRNVTADKSGDATAPAGRLEQTAFERTPGLLGLSAVFVTALTVIFAPWVFARQIGPRSSLPHAVSFFILCLSCTFLNVPFMQETYVYEWDFLPAWIAAVLVYIGLQAGLFTMVDPLGWHRPREALRFWIVAGCYTSAIMMTEICYGPPTVRFADLLSLLRGEISHNPIPLDAQGIVMTAQLLLWAISVAACYWVRLRRARISRTVAWPAAAMAAIMVVALYSLVFEHVGERLYYLVSISSDSG